MLLGIGREIVREVLNRLRLDMRYRKCRSLAVYMNIPISQGDSIILYFYVVVELLERQRSVIYFYPANGQTMGLRR